MGKIDDLEHEKNIPVIIADHQGLITCVNLKFEMLFEWTLAEIKGQPISIIIPRRLHDAHNLGFSRFLSTEKPTLLTKPINLAAIKKSGLEFEAVHTIYGEKINDHWVFGATIVPIDQEITDRAE